MATNARGSVITIGVFTLISATYGLRLASGGTANMGQDVQRQTTDANERSNYTEKLKTCLRLAIKVSRDNNEEAAFNSQLREILGAHSDRPLDLEMTLIMFLQSDLSLFATDLRADAWSQYRRIATRMAMHAWHRIKTSLDKNFDVDDKPFLNLAPPVETGLPSGVSPEAIKDPALRAKYENAIANNAKKAEYYRQQCELRNLDRDFSEKVERYLGEIYRRPPSAVDELSQYLVPDILGKDTVKRLLASVRGELPDE